MTATEKPESPVIDDQSNMDETIAELRKQNEAFRKAIRSLQSEVAIIREQVKTARATLEEINNIRIPELDKND